MKKVILHIFFISCSLSAFCQSTNISTFLLTKANKADQLFYDKAYRNALEIYLRMAEKDGSDRYAKKQIAECYLNLNDPVSAEFWYQFLAKASDVDPQIKFRYAQVLCMNKKYNDALHILKNLDKKLFKGPYIDEQIKFIENIEYHLRDSTLYTVGNISVNSPYSDFAATYFKHDKVIFASTRDYDLMVKRRSFAADTDEESMSNLFQTEQSVSGTYGPVRLFHKDDLKSNFHDGPIVFYNNYSKAAFTRTNFVNGNGVLDATGNVNLKLYFADVGGISLRNIKPFPFNSDGYSTGHATFTFDGKTIFFASTNPLGLGGADIYYSTFENGNWTEPVNAGPNVNTPGDELYPHLENDTTLYFTSNGHGGFGGLDNFICHRRKGKFLNALNLGYLMNTSSDDFAVVTDSSGRLGYFSSNRPGGVGGDDIYRFIAKKYSMQGQTRDRSNHAKVVPHTKISIRDEFGNVLDSTRSDEDGHFRIDLPFEMDISISAEKEGYDILEDIGFSTRGLYFSIDSLMIPMWKHTLFAKGRIFSNETQDILAGAAVLRTDLTTGKTDTVVVSETGDYVFLIYPNHEYKIEARKEGFIKKGFSMNTENIYDGDLLNDIVLEEIYIEKSVPLFDLNKSAIRPEAYKGLDKVVRTLKKYPQTTLNIAAHADSRGSKEYNKRLSSKRAEIVVQYFTSKGIDRKRIESYAFGEELILNKCSDGVKCSEEDHSQNRRVEIKVQNAPIE